MIQLKEEKKSLAISEKALSKLKKEFIANTKKNQEKRNSANIQYNALKLEYDGLSRQFHTLRVENESLKKINLQAIKQSAKNRTPTGR